VNDEFRDMWEKAAMAYFNYYHSICLDGLGKAAKNLSQDKWFLDHISNP
jgi:hypothetical protein